MAAGREIYTVESLAGRGSMHPAQQAMADFGGSQCGYCTPGFVISLFAEQYRPGREGLCNPKALEGNLCRCTGYRPIRDAALSLGPAPDDAFRLRLATPAPHLDELIYSEDGRRFFRPATLQHCLILLQRYPGARMIAGGTDLAVESNLKAKTWHTLVSLEALDELRAFHQNEESVEIGAGLTLSEIAAKWLDAPAVFHEWSELFASPLIRNRATLGGNLGTASPIGDGAPLLLALDASVRIAGPAGDRIVALDGFFTSYRNTMLSANEVLVSIIIPKPFPAIARFYKAAKRRIDDISTVAACIAVHMNDQEIIRTGRLAYGGVAAIPMRAKEAEASLAGELWDTATFQHAQEIVATTLHPIGDHRGSAEYRLAIAQSMIEKFWHEETV